MKPKTMRSPGKKDNQNPRKRTEASDDLKKVKVLTKRSSLNHSRSNREIHKDSSCRSLGSAKRSTKSTKGRGTAGSSIQP